MSGQNEDAEKSDPSPLGSDPAGVKTQGGGLVVVPSRPGGAAAPTSGPVTNQQLLVLPAGLFQGLNAGEVRAMKIIQLQFARDVSRVTSRAYDQALNVLRRSGDDRKPDLAAPQADGGQGEAQIDLDA